MITPYRLNRTDDVRHLLAPISAPTLVLRMEDTVSIPPAHGRYSAESIPGARLVPLPGAGQVFVRDHGTVVVERGGAVRHGASHHLHRSPADHAAVD